MGEQGLAPLRGSQQAHDPATCEICQYVDAAYEAGVADERARVVAILAGLEPRPNFSPHWCNGFIEACGAALSAVSGDSPVPSEEQP